MNSHHNPNSTYNGVAVITNLTNLSRQAVTDIWGDVKANGLRLQSCARHDFAPAADGARRRVCLICGGTASLSDVAWYERGLAHAGVGSV